MTEHPTTDDLQNPDGWEPCASGEIARMVDRRRATDRARRIRYVATVGGVFVLCVGVIVGWTLFTRSYDFGGITCAECLAHADDFAAGRIEDPELLTSVRTHFAECPRCGPHLEEIRESTGATSQGPVVWVVANRAADR